MVVKLYNDNKFPIRAANISPLFFLFVLKKIFILT